MPMKNSLLSFLFFFLAVCFLSGGAAHADHHKGLQGFNSLMENESRAQFRSHWLEVAGYFERAYTESTSESSAAEALFYLGRTHEELGKRSYLRADFEKAEDYYTRVVREFPLHDRAGEAQFRKAGLHLNHYHDAAQAYIEYLRVVYNFSQSRFKPEAQKVLEELDRKNLEKIRQAGGTTTQEHSYEADAAGFIHQPEPGGTMTKMEMPPPAISFQPAQDQDRILPEEARLVTIRHWSSDEYTRVVLDLDSQIDYHHQLLKPDPELGTPHRLFIDLEKTRRGKDIAGEEKVADGILSRIRSAQHTHDKSRVVLDIQELDNFRVFALENPFRIVVDVYAPEERKVLGTIEGGPQITLDPRSRELTAGSLVEQLGLKVRTIMIDPGHGGKDPGAIANGIKEKDVVLRMSRILGRHLEQQGFNVLYTRTRDVFVPLEERTAMANSQKADLFISVHANAHRNPNVRGFEVYYLNFAKTEDAKRVAARENAVSTQKISDLQYILTDLMLSSKINESRNLAQKVHTNTISHAQGRFTDLGDNGVRQAPFYVLMGAKMPSILLELGYMTNERDLRLLQSDDFLEYMAKGLTQGILAYKDKIEQFASLSYKN